MFAQVVWYFKSAFQAFRFQESLACSVVGCSTSFVGNLVVGCWLFLCLVVGCCLSRLFVTAVAFHGLHGFHAFMACVVQ